MVIGLYHNPQANGQAEAALKVVLNRLITNIKHQAENRPDNKYVKSIWATVLLLVIYSYNITKHAATGYSPFQLIFERNPPLQLEVQNFEIQMIQ